MLAENLKALRKAKGLSQEELAARLHVVRQTVSKWEKGRSVPDADLLIRLAEELDTTSAALLGPEVPPEAERGGTAEQLALSLIHIYPGGPAYGGKQACNQESGPHQHQNAKSPGTPQVRQGQPRLDGGLGQMCIRDRTRRSPLQTPSRSRTTCCARQCSPSLT